MLYFIKKSVQVHDVVELKIYLIGFQMMQVHIVEMSGAISGDKWFKCKYIKINFSLSR